MKGLNQEAGRLELIIGCMFSGKSSALITRVRQHRLIGKSVVVFSHSCDTRYGTQKATSHDGDTVCATSLSSLMPVLGTQGYTAADSIFIEEAQFFADLLDFVKHAVEVDCKHVVVCGLDGDYSRQPYGQVIALIPLADIVERKHAFCAVCRDGTLASFSKRLSDETERNIVGGSNLYVPVCRLHYIKDLRVERQNG